MTRRPRITDEEVTDLFDLLVSRQTVTIDEIADHLKIDTRRAREVVHQLRLVFGADDSINLVCTPNGTRQRWLYALVGEIDGSTPWIANRVGDAATRLETMEAVMTSIERATDGRSIEGRRARIIRRACTRAREDLAEL